MAVNPKIELRNYLVDLCRQVSVYMREQLDKVEASDIEEKELNSLVSYVDKQAEKMIVEALLQVTPDAGFITEEDTEDNPDKDQVWIIDPLDGTTNFLRKIPHFSTSIALMEDRKITLGIVYETMHDISYTAIRGQGAWINDKPMKVSQLTEMKDAIVVTGFPYRRDGDMQQSLDMIQYCVLNCRGIRRLGSAALDLAYVACGKLDIYYENFLNIWDIAAGVLLVEEAQGVLTDFENGDQYLETGGIIASNKYLHPGIMKAISDIYS